MRKWLDETEQQHSADIELRATLDEKRAQLTTYRSLLQDVMAHQQAIFDCRDRAQSLPEMMTGMSSSGSAASSRNDERAGEFIESAGLRHQSLLKRAQAFVERYEGIVSDHQQYSKAVMDAQEWLDATHGAIEMWGDVRLERITLHANVERLKNLQLALPEEESRITQIRILGEKVIPGTSELGQSNIRSQIDCSQQEWESLNSTLQSAIDSLETKLKQWADYEALKERCQQWLRQTDGRFHAIDLKSDLESKRAQLEEIKALQSELRGKELEIDELTEKQQQLYNRYGSGGGSSLLSPASAGGSGSASPSSISRSNSQTLELAPKYQQIMSRIKELSTKWQDYVDAHQDFNGRLEDCFSWLTNVKDKLAYCSDLSASSQEDLDSKMTTIQDLLMYKEEGFVKVQSAVELAQSVLANTAPAGHDAINSNVDRLKAEWGQLASKMMDTKANLDGVISKWAGFLEQIHQLKKIVEGVEASLAESSQPQSTLSEKRTQLERLKNLGEKIKCERIEVNSLKSKAAEMMASGQQNQAAGQAHQILDKFQRLAEQVKAAQATAEEDFKAHKTYKEAYDELMTWISRAREKVPSMKHRPLGDRLAIEEAVFALTALLNKQAQGQLRVEELQRRSQQVLLGSSTASAGQATVASETRALVESFELFFRDVQSQKDQLSRTVVQWREYKEEYERLSDWIQQTDIEIKAQKNALLSTLQEKEKQAVAVAALADRLEKGEEQMTKFNDMAAGLLSSHLDTYVTNQLRHINSRYQVERNLVKDVQLKIATNVEQHRNYETAHAGAVEWIEHARQVVKSSSSGSEKDTTKEELQQRLDKINDLLKRQEEGQTLVHSAVNYGEKVARYTRSDGRERIQTSLKELQQDWERLGRRMANSKVSLETSLLQWADYSSSCSHLKQWITEKEAKLQQVSIVDRSARGSISGMSGRPGGSGLRTLSIGARQATLRRTGSFVQDIVSFEPMIESVTSKVDARTAAAGDDDSGSGLSDTDGGHVVVHQHRSPTAVAEISDKYQSLSRQAHEVYAQQKRVMDVHQSFIDAGNEFMHWLRVAKEAVNKLSEPTGDRESLGSKVAHVSTKLVAERSEGQHKLDTALEKADAACKASDEEDREIVEEEVAFLQEEFDNYCEALSKLKASLESGLVKWTEYEDQYQDATEWLAATEATVKSFNRLQNTLSEKRDILEQFQTHLQAVFDWQKDLDRLNMRAQQLLETCADSRVSNAVTSVTTKYNALLSLAKEVMRRLEVQFQEHQQHTALYHECQDWIEKTREKVTQSTVLKDNLSELKGRLHQIKAVRDSLEQGHHKLRYVGELKERVILNTEQAGAQQIHDDTDTLRAEFDRLSRDVQEAREALSARIAVLEEIDKAHQMFVDWLQEIVDKVPSQDDDAAGVDALTDLSDKKSALEKYRVVQEALSHTEVLQRLRDKLASQPDLPSEEYDASMERYEQLKASMASTIGRMEERVRQHDEYRQACTEATDWMRRARLDVQQFGDFNGEKRETLDDNQRRLCELRLTFAADGEPLVEKAGRLSEHVLAGSSAEGQEAVRKELSELRSEWENLNSFSDETLKSLSDCCSAWSDFDEVFQRIKRWLTDFQAKWAVEGSGSTTVEDASSSEQRLTHCRELLKEAESQKAWMEDLNDRCEILTELITCGGRVREETVQLQAGYTAVMGNVQSALSRLEKTRTDHTEFVTAKDDFANWLERAQLTVQDCCVPGGDEAAAREKHELVRSLASRLTEGQHLLNVMMDNFTRAL